MTPLKYKEKALTPLKIPELLSTPPRNNKNGLVPLEIVNMVYTPLKTRDPPPEDVFDTFPYLRSVPSIVDKIS